MAELGFVTRQAFRDSCHKMLALILRRTVLHYIPSVHELYALKTPVVGPVNLEVSFTSRSARRKIIRVHF